MSNVPNAASFASPIKTPSPEKLRPLPRPRRPAPQPAGDLATIERSQAAEEYRPPGTDQRG